MELSFTKMHGLGNDFIVIDNLAGNINLNEKQIKFLSDRHFGIGFDQLLMVEKTLLGNIDFKYRIFNADGQEVEQCGNGARCFAYYVREKNLSDKDIIKVETKKSIITLYHEGKTIRVNMGIPEFSKEIIPILDSGFEYNSENNTYTVNRSFTNESIAFSAVSMGNPHITILVEDVDKFPVDLWGKELVTDSLFPQGINVGFMELDSKQKIKLRVYERGTGETLACGSGACAAVVNGIRMGVLESHVEVQLPGGKLQIKWQGESSPVWMSGSAKMVFEGKIDI